MSKEMGDTVYELRTFDHDHMDWVDSDYSLYHRNFDSRWLNDRYTEGYEIVTVTYTGGSDFEGGSLLVVLRRSGAIV